MLESFCFLHQEFCEEAHDLLIMFDDIKKALLLYGLVLTALLMVVLLVVWALIIYRRSFKNLPLSIKIALCLYTVYAPFNVILVSISLNQS